jgi:twitching motility protein PilT
MADEQRQMNEVTPIQAVSPQVEVPVPASAPVPNITLDQLVNLAIEQNASDIHFGEGSRVALRKEGKFVFIENVAELSKEEVEAMINEMVTDVAERRRLETVRELDFSYVHSTGVSFRVNAYYSQGQLKASMRMISKHLPSVDEIGIPEVMKKALQLKEGLILVTGSTGSGKSTSTQAMLQYVNENFVYHVITIENPIEHIFKEEKSIFSQREIGKDTLTYPNALHSASREDPNLIMVSEINDSDTLDEVLSLVESGHLVIATMPTKNVIQTIEHIVTMYTKEEQPIMLDRLSENLVVVMSQDLLDRVDEPGRVAVYEVMVANKAAKHIIKHATFDRLRTTMEQGAQEGMVTMDNYAYQLAQSGIIAQDAVQQYLPENS